MRGDSGGVTVDGFRDIPAGVYLWGEPSGAHGDTGWCSQNEGYCYHRALL